MGSSRDSANYFFNLGNYVASLKHSQTYLAQTTDDLKRADALILTGRCFRRLGDQSESIAVYKQSVKILHGLQDSVWLPYALQGLGLAYKDVGDYQLATQYLYQSTDYLQHLKDTLSMANNYVDLGSIFRITREFSTSKSYYYKALDLYSLKSNLQKVLLVRNNLAVLLTSLSESDEAKKLLLNNLRIVGDSNLVSLSRTYLNLGNLFWKLDEFDSAEHYFLQSLQLKLKLNQNKKLANLYNNLADLYLSKNEPLEAKTYLQKAHRIATSKGYLALHSTNMRLRSEFYRLTQRLDSSLTYLKIHHSLEDSLLNQQKARALTEMQVRFETEEKEKALAQAEIQASTQQQLLDLQRSFIWGLAILALLALIVGFLAYRLYRINQAEKRRVQLRMREQHHRIGNNISVMASVLSLAAQNTTSKEARDLAEDGENRLNAMNLLHKQLYWEEEQVSIRLDQFIPSLVQHLSGVFNTRQVPVDLQMNPVSLDVERAIPLCLILNELLTNAFKHGIAANEPKLQVSLNDERDRIKLKVEDNGPGISNRSEEPSFGKNLVETLTRQINGQMTVDTGRDGTAFLLSFR